MCVCVMSLMVCGGELLCSPSQLLKQWKWKRCPHRNFFALVIVSRQMMHTASVRASSSSVASGKSVFILRVIRRYRTRSLTLDLKERHVM